MSTESEGSPPQAALRLSDLEDDLVLGLADHLPGLEILDRALVLATGAEGAALRADLVAVDAFGRLVLILLVEGRADETVVIALESLGGLRASQPSIVQHLRSQRLSSAAPPLLVLVAETFAPRIVRSLGAASPRELCLFELREISSAKGVRSAFVPVDLATRASSFESGSRAALRSSASGARAPTDALGEDFLAALPPHLRPAAELCLARVDRIDTNLDRRASYDVVTWRYREHSLCSVAWMGERLVGLIAPRGGTFPIQELRDVDPFVDRVLSEHLRRLDGTDPADAEGSPDNALASPDPARGFLLSPEEIAAFRD